MHLYKVLMEWFELDTHIIYIQFVYIYIYTYRYIHTHLHTYNQYPGKPGAEVSKLKLL